MHASEKRRLARALVKSVDGAFALAVACILACGFASPAYAYVDPSVMTYTIQALAGVAVALSAVLGVVWRRLRRFLLRVLKIDENAGKESDPAVHRLDRSDAAYAERAAAADAAARRMRASLASEKPERLCWTTRFLFALAASIMLFFTVAVAAPLEIVASSGESLFFTVGDVWAPLAAFACAGALVLAGLLSLLRGRAFGAAFAVTAALGIAAAVQAMFLNRSLPAADGSAVAWGDYTAITVASAVVWIAAIVLAVVFSVRKSLLFKGVASTLCLVGAVAQSVGLGMLLLTPGEDGYAPVEARPTVTMDGISEVSSKDNVIVFVLDTFDTRYLRDTVAADPSCLDGFTGFTWFDNSAGSMIPTRYAMSTFLTGRSLGENDEAYSNELIRSWYTEHNLLDDIGEQGYQVDLYATDIYDAIGALSDKAANVKPLERAIDEPAAVSMLLRCALYRDAPWALKPWFWFYTDQVNNAVLDEAAADAAGSVWKMDDAGYYAMLEEQGLQAVDKGENGSFRVIHLAGTHLPYTLDRNAQYVEAGTDCVEQGLGALHIVDEYLAELKRLGLYDSATIVVTADHGEWYLADEISGPTTPMLLVKPSTEAGGSDAPLAVSSVPTGHLDFAATVLDAIGGDASAYGGMSVFDVPDADRPRYYCSTSVVGPDHEYTRIKQWKIDGDATDWQDWSDTGVEWPIR